VHDHVNVHVDVHVFADVVGFLTPAKASFAGFVPEGQGTLAGDEITGRG
jgi:hypothetical protein